MNDAGYRYPTRVSAPPLEASMDTRRCLQPRVSWRHWWAAISGYAVVRTGKAMMRDGIEIQDGGGWAALLIGEVCVSFAAVGVALS